MSTYFKVKKTLSELIKSNFTLMLRKKNLLTMGLVLGKIFVWALVIQLY